MAVAELAPAPPAAERLRFEPPAAAVSVESLGKRYVLQGPGGVSGWNLFRRKLDETHVHWALRDVSFRLEKGERVGVIGRNGAGKSTLLKILSRVLAPSEGRATIRGRVTSLLEVGTGFSPDLTGLENIYLNAALHGLSRAEIEARVPDIVAFSEIGRFVHEPVKHYSTGMRSRLGFAVAAHLDPDILMLDEVLSVGDASFQNKCLARMEDMTSVDRTLLFVSHSTPAVRRFCDRCLWIDKGRVVMDGPAVDVTLAYDEAFEQARAYEAPKAVRKDGTSDGAAAESLEEGEPAALVSARVLDERGDPTSAVRIDTAASVEVVFDVHKAGRRIEPALHFRNERDEMLFVVAFTDPDRASAFDAPGRYRAKAAIPPNLLNEGLHKVTVALVTADPLVRHQLVENAAAFTVYELQRVDPLGTARGRYARNFPGGLRPRLDWTAETVR